LTALDWAVLSLYLAAIVSFGVFMGRGSRRPADFFLAGRQMPWWAAGLSVMATQISAITFVGTTGQAYAHGMGFLVVYFGLPFAMVILCATLVPFFYRAGVFTAYEYLERRFDGRVRTVTSLLFLSSRGLSVGITLYAPSLVLSVILGWSEGTTVLLMAGVTIAYVVHGGNRSVIWTDVAQMGIIWLGIFLSLGVALAQLPAHFGLHETLALAQVTDHLKIMDLSADPRRPYTVWGGLVGGLFLALAYFGTDQSQVQRYLSGRSLTESRLSLLFNAFLKVPMQFLILLTGVVVFVFYHFEKPPLLWNAAALARLEREAPPEDVRDLRRRFDRAFEERRDAAEALARARAFPDRRGEEGRERGRYLAAGQRLDEARAGAVAAIERIDGGVPYDDTNYVFPTYIVSQLPRGLAGLVIAVIFAAAMSTLSGELNSLATTTMVDFYGRFVRPDAREAHLLWGARAATAFWGAFAAYVALEAGRLGSAIEVVNRFGSYFYGSILGVFGLAVLVPRASAVGALAGLFVGMTAVAAVANLTTVHFLWYNVVGAAAVMLVGVAVSAAVPGPRAPSR
jgi:Na+/proline symporter